MRKKVIAVLLCSMLFASGCSQKNTDYSNIKIESTEKEDMDQVAQLKADCIKAIAESYEKMKSDGCYVTSYITKDEPIYNFGFNESDKLYLLQSDNYKFKIMYYSEKEDKLYYQDRVSDMWYYTTPEETHSYINSINERAKEFMTNYLDYADAESIEIADVTFEGKDCYDISFLYNEDRLFAYFMGKEYTPKDLDHAYYKGHYYLKKDDLLVLNLKTMIDEIHFFQDKSIELPKETENAVPKKSTNDILDSETVL